MTFFSDFFFTPYPFSKLDQIIAPSFSSGGMENVAAITYRESYIQRGKKRELNIVERLVLFSMRLPINGLVTWSP